MWWSSSASWLKSAWAELSEERNASWASRSARISSRELHLTGSVRSSSAFSNQLLKADAFLANVRNKSSTWSRGWEDMILKTILIYSILPEVCCNASNVSKLWFWTKVLHHRMLYQQIYLSEVFLSLQKLLLASSWVRQQLVPALHQGSVTSFYGFWLDVLGSQQLVLESCNVGDTLLLEGLETSIKCLLQADTDTRCCQQKT